MAISFRHDAANVAGIANSVMPSRGNRTRSGRGRNSGVGSGRNLLLDQQKFAQDNFRRMQDRMFDIGKMNIANQFQMQRDNRMLQADQDLLKMRNELQDQQFMKQRDLEQKDLNDKLKRDRIQEGTRKVEDRVAQVRAMFGQQQYTQDGKDIWGNLSGSLRAIEAQRDTLRPKQYNAMLNKWLDDAESAGLENFVAAPPTVQDTLDTNFKDLGTGYGVFMQPDGKMEVREIDPAKIAGAKGGGGIAAMSPAEYFADESNYNTSKKNALEAMKERYLAENPDATADPGFSAEQIHEEMMREFKERQGFLQGLAGNQGGNQPASQPGAQPGMQPGAPGNAPTSPAGPTSYDNMSPEEKAQLQRMQDIAAGRPVSPVQPPSQPVQPPAMQPSTQPGVAPGDSLSSGAQQGGDTPAMAPADAKAMQQYRQDAQDRYKQATDVINDIDGKIAGLKKIGARRGLSSRDREKVAALESQRDKALADQAKASEDVQLHETALRAQKDIEVNKQPGVQGLQSSGYDSYDYASAKRTIDNLKQKYPDIQAMPPEDRKKLDAALQVIQAASAKQ